jgi:hypothetical protein
VDEDLTRFVDHAREKGLDLATLRQLLRTAGWKDAQIAEAFSARELELPIPLPPGASSARDVFLQVFAFTTLYTWVIALLVLLFAYVNLGFPDTAVDASAGSVAWAHERIRGALAALLVSYPLFLWVWRAALREVERHPAKRRASVRRALLYVSLFAVAVTLLVDAITLVAALLEGELSTRFALKAAALFVVTGGVAVYLRLVLRQAGEPAS